MDEIREEMRRDRFPTCGGSILKVRQEAGYVIVAKRSVQAQAKVAVSFHHRQGTKHKDHRLPDPTPRAKCSQDIYIRQNVRLGFNKSANTNTTRNRMDCRWCA